MLRSARSYEPPDPAASHRLGVLEELVRRYKGRQAIADAGAEGAFILSSSNSIHSSCRPENVPAMVHADYEFGVY